MPTCWKQGLHADAQGLVVAVDGGPDSGFTAYAGLRTPARIGAMMWSRRASRALMVRVAGHGSGGSCRVCPRAACHGACTPMGRSRGARREGGSFC